MRPALWPIVMCLVCTPLVFADEPAKPDFEAEWKALEAEYAVAWEAFDQAWDKAEESGDEKALEQLEGPEENFLPRYRDLASRARGTDAGLQAHLRGIDLMPGGNPGEFREALGVLREVYLESPGLEPFVASMRGYTLGTAETTAFLRTVLEKSPHKSVKAAALFALGRIAGQGEINPDGVILVGLEKDAARRAEAIKLLKRVQTEYADTPYPEKAKPPLFELERLQIGMEAPDFEARDLDDKPFKLSEYRGKVVVLDFWGFW